jgi:hypothetical protein
MKISLEDRRSAIDDSSKIYQNLETRKHKCHSALHTYIQYIHTCNIQTSSDRKYTSEKRESIFKEV